MNRVRVGLTGLGAVFLLTLGASLVFDATDRDQPAAHAQKEPGEPLAQLGVAPGSEKGMATTRPRRDGLADDAGDETGDKGARDRDTGNRDTGDGGSESPIAATAGLIPGEPSAT